MTSLFSAEGSPIWIKFRRLVQNDMSSAVMCRNGNQMWNFNMADVWANSMACHPRATYHIAGCCHLVNSLSRFQSHMLHFRVQSPDEINVVNVPHCRVSEFLPPYWKSFSPYFIILFLMQFRLWRAARLSYRLRYTCLQSSSSCYASKWIELAWLTKNVRAVESLQHHDQRSSSLTLIGPQIGTRSIFLWRKS